MSNLVATQPPETALADRPRAVGLADLITAGRPETAKALAGAILGSHAVEKAARNNYHKYRYASADAIIEAGREALANAGLALLPIESSLVGSERQGPDRFELVRTLLLIHVAGEVTPIRVTWPVIPQDGRPLDKATAAADTLSLSYLLRDLLQLPRVDPSDDPSAREDRPPQGKPTKKRVPLPANGTELLARLARKEAALVEQGRCQKEELLEEIKRQGRLLKAPEKVADWPAEIIRLTPDWVRAFEAQHPTPAKPDTPPSNGAAKAAPATKPGRITVDQIQALQALLQRKNRTWALIRQIFDVGANAFPSDLNPGQLARITAALNEEPDAPAGRS